MGGCSGTPTAGIVGGGIIFSYLLLFLDFFYETYIRKAQRRPEPSAAPSEGLLFRVEKSRFQLRLNSQRLTVIYNWLVRGEERRG